MEFPSFPPASNNTKHRVLLPSTSRGLHATTIMSSADIAKARERNRVRSGHMRGLSRLILFSRHPLVSLQSSRWWHLPAKDVAFRPPGVAANVHLSKTKRQDLLNLSLKGSDDHFVACVFARVEEGKCSCYFHDLIRGFEMVGGMLFPSRFNRGFPAGVTAKDVDCIIEDQLEPTFRAFFHNGENSLYQAYMRVLRMFPEGVFYGFSYPNLSLGEMYQLKVLSGSRGEVTHVPAEDSPDEVNGTEWGGEDTDDPPAGPDDDEDSDDYVPAERVVTPPTSPLPARNSKNLSPCNSLFREATLTDSEVRFVLASTKGGPAMPMELDGAGPKVNKFGIYVVRKQLILLFLSLGAGGVRQPGQEDVCDRQHLQRKEHQVITSR